jgi:arabinan endo-1,5-alpha-L-arabinosidase
VPRPLTLLLAAALPLALPLTTVVPAAGSAAPAPPERTRPVATSYSNPLQPDIGDGRTLDSCADPIVLRAQQPDDPYWYLYCTTDPLDDEDRDEEGNLIFNKIPQLRSMDLVNWEYVGNAFVENPSWAEDNAALWAPDVVYSSTFDQYYMFVTVTETKASVSGVEDCNGDSAIGVATSDSPTGPWEFSDTPAVAPRQNPETGGLQLLLDVRPRRARRHRRDDEPLLLRQLLRRGLRGLP